MKKLLTILSILTLSSCYTKKDVDKAYKAGVYDGGIYTYKNKDSVMPSMWHREAMLYFHNRGIEWTETYWTDINKFWDSVENNSTLSK